MKRKSISFIIGLMGVALLGVLAMQLYFLQQSYKLKAQLFDQSVNQALSNVVNKLEKHDVINFALNRADTTPKIAEEPSSKSAYRVIKIETREKNDSLSPEVYAKLLNAEQRKADSIFTIRDSMFRARHPIGLSLGTVAVNPNGEPEEAEVPELEIPDMHLEIVQFVDVFGNLHQKTVLVPDPPRIRHKKPQSSERKDSLKRYVYFDPERGAQMILPLGKPKITRLNDMPQPRQSEKTRAKKFRHVVDSMQLITPKKDVFEDLRNEFKMADIPLKMRLKPPTLDSMLKYELSNRGINLPFEYKVTSTAGDHKDAVIFRSASNITGFTDRNSYKTQLFPKDVIRDAGLLTITFPQKNTMIFANMAAMMGSSGALLLILIFCFGYTLHSILKQKKISEMKTDFINNMTHEFKTPVSTIMIASEALKDPDVIENKNQVNKLAGIIYDENVRLGNHIERVLNIARIDRDDLKMEQEYINVNDIIAAIVDSLGLKLEKQNAIIQLYLNATNPVIIGDELHFSNVIFNLLDNAIKYSNQEPSIKITTANTSKYLMIKVTDNGIGMNKDQLDKIFEQFYRVPTGNLHDVKGFGLGLSYVYNIVKRMEGKVSAKSEKEKGSEFILTFPPAKN